MDHAEMTRHAANAQTMFTVRLVINGTRLDLKSYIELKNADDVARNWAERAATHPYDNISAVTVDYLDRQQELVTITYLGEPALVYATQGDDPWRC